MSSCFHKRLIHYRRNKDRHGRNNLLQTYNGEFIHLQQGVFSGKLIVRRFLNLDPCAKLDNPVCRNLVIICRTACIARNPDKEVFTPFDHTRFR